MRFINVVLLLLFGIELFSQTDMTLKIEPGLYTSYDRTRTNSGFFLFRGDSSLLFLGLSNVPVNPCFALYQGAWYCKGTELYMKFHPLEPKKCLLYNSDIEYHTTSKPSYDSVYFDINVSYESTPRFETDALLGNEKVVKIVNGVFKGGFKTGELACPGKITIPEGFNHIPDGGHYATEVMLDPAHNNHVVKIRLPAYSEIPLILSVINTGWHSYKFTKQVSENLNFGSGFVLKEEKDTNALEKFAKTVKQKNPVFTSLIDSVISDFKK